MAVVANEDGELMMQDPLGQENGIVTGTTDEVDEVEEEIEMQELKVENITSSKSSAQSTPSDSKLQKEMETCFGFDEVSISGFNSINFFQRQNLSILLNYNYKKICTS